jgi:hypothetical protein
MLKYFFEIETDSKGKILPLNERSNNKLFTDLKISTDQNSMAEQGQYPVIFFSLKNTSGNDYQEIENNVSKKVQDAYKLHDYLIDGNQLNSFDKQKLQNYYQGKIKKVDLQFGLHFLSELLYKHFKKKAILLIDEYDETINHAYVQFGHRSQEFGKVLHLTREILSAALKDNSYLEKSVLTGILRIAKSNLFSGLNNLKEYNLLDERFTEFYGFTQKEVNELLTKIPKNIVDSDDIKD